MECTIENFYQLMKSEIIGFDPRLNKKHKLEFLKFCKKLSVRLKKKGSQERFNILSEEKELVNKKYSGKHFHANTDLAFVENLLIDLMLQDWDVKINKNKVQIELQAIGEKSTDINEVKSKTRRRHLFARDVQLNSASVRDFIRSMEKKRLTKDGWHSIFSVMRDGGNLSKHLQDIISITDDDRKIELLKLAVKPYIQVVEPGKICSETGLMLSDIWRYFRHTWVNEYKSLPGRSISILVRDAAVAGHPVIGIAALGSSVAQQTCRDRWIGWEGNTFLEKIKHESNLKYAKWIDSSLHQMLDEIYLKDFLKEKIINRSDIKNPTKERIVDLKKLSGYYKVKHINNPHSAKFSAENSNLSWSQRAETFLFKSKRTALLAELLEIKMILKNYEFVKSKKKFESALAQKIFCDAIQKLVRKVKAIHVGINMMDIIVCGSIAPYNHLLGGKLVCLLLTSPEITKYYGEKYKDAISLIASSMSGKPIKRKPQLVLLGTTSLYGIGSSQYNRIKLPVDEIEGDNKFNIEYKELGFSEGFGSFHFSNDTTSLADAVIGRENGRVRVNSIFGEGSNPLIRKLRDAFDFFGLDSDPILKHRNRRIVYGVALAENFGELLLGLSNTPKYFIHQARPQIKTQMIANYWIKRWLLKRINNSEVLIKVASHSLSYPISHGARVPLNQVISSQPSFDF